MAEQLWQQSSDSGVPFSVLVLDIDFFKSINDAYSHQAGDLVLKKVAHSLRFSLRSQDKFRRVGGKVQQADLLQLWHLADTALHQVKHQGQNQAVLFSG